MPFSSTALSELLLVIFQLVLMSRWESSIFEEKNRHSKRKMHERQRRDLALRPECDFLGSSFAANEGLLRRVSSNGINHGIRYSPRYRRDSGIVNIFVGLPANMGLLSWRYPRSRRSCNVKSVLRDYEATIIGTNSLQMSPRNEYLDNERVSDGRQTIKELAASRKASNKTMAFGC